MVKKLSILSLATLSFTFILSGCSQPAQIAADQPAVTAPAQKIETGSTQDRNSKLVIQPSANTISIKEFKFTPDTLTVSQGTAVTWTNNDTMPHTVTSAGLFDSGAINNGESFSFTFSTKGTFNYKCSIHPSMTGTIIVN